MNELVKFLTTKIGYTICIILGFLLPGACFIFVWNREICMQMDIFKLVLLALSVSFMLYIPSLIIASLALAICNDIKEKKEYYLVGILFTSVCVSVTFTISAIVNKIYNPTFSIRDLLDKLIKIYLPLLLILGVTSLIVDKFLWIKNKINKGKVIKTEQTSNSTEQT